jgi:hypothetical protein
MPPTSSPLDVALAWQDAANRQDAGALELLSHPEIEIVGPRGSARGRQLLRDWLARANLALESRRSFARGDAVVLDQRGTWRSAEANEIVGEADVATSFRVDGGRVTRLARFDRLGDALRDADLGEEDEAPGIGG